LALTYLPQPGRLAIHYLAALFQVQVRFRALFQRRECNGQTAAGGGAVYKALGVVKIF